MRVNSTWVGGLSVSVNQPTRLVVDTFLVDRHHFILVGRNSYAGAKRRASVHRALKRAPHGWESAL